MGRQALQARIQGEVEERAATRLRASLEAGRADHEHVLNAEARVLGLRDRWLEKRMFYASAEAQLEAAVGEVPGW
jgi:hypothetical protein